MHKDGDETITGLKSVPTPTAAEHIARKDYVDQNINFAAAKQCNAYAESKTVATATNTALALTVAAPYAGIAIITMGETVNEAAFTGVIEGKIMVGGVQKARTAYKYASADYPAPQTTWTGVVASGTVITFAVLHTKGSNANMGLDINVTFLRIV